MKISFASRVLGVNRSLFYRTGKQRNPGDKELLKKISCQIEKMPGCGYKKYAHILGVNHKKIYRIMKDSGLLQKRRTTFKVKTTDSNHRLPVFENLAKNISTNALDQLWVGDITYIHLQNNRFAYLATVIDAHSRRIIGWSFDLHMRAELCTSALQKAIETRQKKTFNHSLVFHSDRGSQYASTAHRKLLDDCGIKGSMSGKGYCYDNSMAESFFRTLKVEDVYLKDYRNLKSALSGIGNFIENIYNRQRPHWGIHLSTPMQFENDLLVEQNVA